MRLILLVAIVLVIQGCKHPLTIVGQGDIEELNNSGRGCTFEEFNQGAARCSMNEVTGDYIVRYRAKEREGWRFVRWDGPCQIVSAEGYCEFNTVAAWVAWWDSFVPAIEVPATMAVFEPVSDSGGGGGDEGAFAALDTALASRQVSTSSPDGLWLFYAHGSTDAVSNLIPGTTATTDMTVNLFAYVASVHLTDNNGESRIIVNQCSRSSDSNTGFSAGIALDDQQFPYTWRDVWRSGAIPLPFAAPGDTPRSVTDAITRTATIVNNREITFSEPYSFRDDMGMWTGGFEANFKARKLSDDGFATLGRYEVNGQMTDTHCYFYSDFEEHQESSNADGSAGTDSIGDLEGSKAALVSFPDKTAGRTDFFYQFLRSETSFNGVPSPPMEATAVSLRNVTSGLNVQVNTAISTDQVDVEISVSPALELTLDYVLSPSISSDTWMGTIEAKP